MRWHLKSIASLGALVCAGVGLVDPVIFAAQQPRRLEDGAYTEIQASTGQILYTRRCASCHGEMLEGALAPPLTGNEFMGGFANSSLFVLVDKIQKTMPADDPGVLSADQAIDLVAYILKVGKFPPGQTDLATTVDSLKQIIIPPASPSPPGPIVPAISHTPSFPPAGNLAQLMRGILFPSSNIVFNVQTNDPAQIKPAPGDLQAGKAFSWVDWGGGIYSPWEIVDYAAISLAESAPLLLVPGRRCENGKAVPVERADWVRFTEELAQAGRDAYKAAQTRNQQTVAEVSNEVADACLHCHETYRDKPGGNAKDPSNKAARCVP